jgi:hypothetical protein
MSISILKKKCLNQNCHASRKVSKYYFNPWMSNNEDVHTNKKYSPCFLMPVDLVLFMIITFTSNANSSNISRLKLVKFLNNITHPKQQPWDPLGSQHLFPSPIMKNSKKSIAVNIK